MHQEDLIFPKEIYSAYLKDINDVELTDRQAEVLSYLLHTKKNPKEISRALLTLPKKGNPLPQKPISPKTVNSHVDFIKGKFNIKEEPDGSIREKLVQIIRGSGKAPFFKKYHLSLQYTSIFEKVLQKVSRLHTGEKCKCLIVSTNEGEKESFLLYIQAHLHLAGIEASLELTEEKLDPQHIICEKQAFSWVLYILSRKKMGQLKENGSISLLFNKEAVRPTPLLLTFDKVFHPTIYNQEIKELGVSANGNYYYCILEIIQKVLPHPNLENIRAEFREQYEHLRTSVHEKLSQTETESRNIKKDSISTEEKNSEHEIEEKNIETRKKVNTLIEKNWTYLSSYKIYILISGFIGIGLSALVIGYLDFSPPKKEESKEVFNPLNKQPVRSDLVLPSDAALLQRPELLKKIKNSFRNNKDIQTIALVGMGGAGKTTLARQYARQQSMSVLYELNAATPGNLSSSFEGLAQALTKTQKDQIILNNILSINNTAKKETRIIQFVKERLRVHRDWFLIFDNVEKFTEVQKYFPQDSSTWGQGKIILTTRDNNIQNNPYINNLVFIEELTPEQKFDLFAKIVSHSNNSFLKQGESTKTFLEHIPPFPLDVVVAAYYLISTRISYEAYIEVMAKYNKEFEEVQKDLLKEASNYTKTRYGIIISSLQHILKSHKDFADLLFLITLIDSQSIPRKLLEKCKNKATVDKFIYNLQKHSLITKNSAQASNEIFTLSIHRSTQAISLAYLIKNFGLQRNKDFIYQLSIILENYVEEEIYKGNLLKTKESINHIEFF